MRTRLGVDPQVLALALARMAESIGNSFLIIVLPIFISESVTGSTLGLSEVAITGVVLALFGLVNSPLQPFVGRFSDRLGRRKVFVLVGLVLIATAGVAYSFATTYWHLLAIRTLQGIAGALIIPTTVALVNDLATDDNRGGNMGTYNTFRLVGFGVGPIGAGAVLSGGPYGLTLGPLSTTVGKFDAAFYFAALTAVVSLLLVLFTVRDPDIEPQPQEEGDRSAFRVFDHNGDRDRLLDPVFTLGLVAFFMAAGIALFATLGGPINERLDQGETMFGLQFAAFVLAQILLQAPIGRATDFYGRKRFIVAGTVLLVPATLVQGFVLNSWLMFLARFVQGVAGAMVFAPGLALAGDLAAEGESGSTLSVLTMAFGFGIAFGPLASGFLYEFGFSVPFVFGAALAAVGAVLVQTQVDEVLSLTQSSPADPDPGADD
jgi:MFS family permease